MSTVDRVYDTLRHDIVLGVLRPGQPLAEQEIAERLSLSRTPVREAIRRLAFEGLLTVVPNRGVFVREITARDVNEIFQLREAMEGYALRTAGPSIPRAELQRLLDAHEAARADGNDEAREQELLEANDAALHELIIRRLGNERVNAWLAVSNSQISLLRHVSWASRDRYVEASEETHAVLTAMLAGEFERAHEILVNHLRAGRAFLLETLATRDLSADLPPSQEAAEAQM